MNESCKALDEFYDYIKGYKSSDTPACDVLVSVESKSGSCVIMVTKKKENSELYISCNEDIVSTLECSIFNSATIDFKYLNGKLIFTTEQNKKVEIKKI
ncbi:hypothetical protein [Treponema putidum]|uniref:Uncharacterized protein n=1 Tax=Treponema putidum TaxID=221027 RepID=A0ABY5HUX4_9SPIR|nr:hypothetical protein [Treponema putidum]UTY28005.1 hypothetical protein E4N76_02670 [Treponema putidum]